MAILTNALNTKPTTTTSLSSDGVVTPTTSTEAPGDRSMIDDWLRLSNSRPQVFCDKCQDDTIEFGSLIRRSDPRAGNVFLIIDNARNRILACKDGSLHFEDYNTIDPRKPIPLCWQCLCTEKKGFKGFQNIAERGFLGHDIKWKFHAKAPHHEDWESFSFVRHHGYYWIQTLNWFTQWQMSARPDGRGVFADRDGGTLWEFVTISPVHGGQTGDNTTQATPHLF